MNIKISIIFLLVIVVAFFSYIQGRNEGADTKTREDNVKINQLTQELINSQSAMYSCEIVRNNQLLYTIQTSTQNECTRLVNFINTLQTPTYVQNTNPPVMMMFPQPPGSSLPGFAVP
ncbi:MAG: hypothetical protein M1366_05725 [Patescibacteria group bacterium]|nr:hypothetical protein [Patescibacteria group bacterium]